MKFSQSGKDKVKQTEDRANIVKVLDVENERVSKAVEELYAHEGYDKQEAIGYCNEIIDSVNNIMAAGDWESSLFLRNVIKPLKEVSDDAKRILSELTEAKGEAAEEAMVIADHQLLIYVSLYNTVGYKLEAWESQLKTIDSHLQGRPIYTDEASIKRVIRLKTDVTNEAYVILLIDKKALETPNAFEDERQDNYGNSLKSVKVGAVDASHIIEFVHDGVRYDFSRGRLHENAAADKKD